LGASKAGGCGAAGSQRAGGKHLVSASGGIGFGMGDVARPGEVKMWDAELWQPADPIRGDRPWVWSSTGRLLATGLVAPKGPAGKGPSGVPGMKNAIQLWDTTTRTILRTLRLDGESVRARRFSPDDRVLAALTGEKKVVLWDVETGKLLGLLEGHTQTILDVRISRDGKSVASAQMAPLPPFDELMGKTKVRHTQEGPSVNLWDLSTRALRATLADAQNPRFIGAGQTLLTADKGNILVIRDAATGKERSRFSRGDGSIDDMKVSADGRFAVLGLTRNVDKNRISELRCFDLTTGRQQAAFLQPDWGLQTFTFTPDSRFVVSSHGRALNEGGTLKVWDLERAQLVRSWRAHQFAFTGLAVSPDGQRLASASRMEVKLWDLVTFQELLELPGSSPVSFFRDGRSLLSGTADKTDVRAWRAATDAKVKARSDR
jgi:WD40 repeat protein